ncbi:hypothetical protein [Marixanthomonas spongiae]|uniref:Uncharacterized protein n=1 Tax=Marixanthomonas spongiae TaxID=2174845 RepID=A0A2U0HZ63_9FLAO|nr:hypothetical protein [Marixanthomonas spongiae]PVW14172.1 hypothetical protein DDV96_10180 [Marixanthomonas spongiae]
MKKFLFTTFIFSVVILAFCSCNQKENIYEEEFEQAVFYELFPAILDSLHYDKRLMPPAPPPSSFVNSNGIRIEYDSINYKQVMENWKIHKQKILKDTASVYLIVSDSIENIERNDLYKLKNHFDKQNITIETNDLKLKEGYRVDLKKLKAKDKKIKFKYRSEFPKGRDFWKNNYNIYIAASISFDHILFDKTKNFGVLNAGYTLGILSGNGVRIFIKKEANGKWVIDDIVGTWVS